MLWGTEKRFGWHLTNIVILLTALYTFYRFLRLFIESEIAILSGLVSRCFVACGFCCKQGCMANISTASDTTLHSACSDLPVG